MVSGGSLYTEKFRLFYRKEISELFFLLPPFLFLAFALISKEISNLRLFHSWHTTTNGSSRKLSVRARNTAKRIFFSFSFHFEWSKLGCVITYFDCILVDWLLLFCVFFLFIFIYVKLNEKKIKEIPRLQSYHLRYHVFFNSCLCRSLAYITVLKWSCFRFKRAVLFSVEIKLIKRNYYTLVGSSSV